VLLLPLVSARSLRELATERANSSRFARSVSSVSQKATLSVAAAGELVISRGDSAVDLQVTDHALDVVALAIHAPVPADFGLAIGLRRNAERMPASCSVQMRAKANSGRSSLSARGRGKKAIPRRIGARQRWPRDPQGNFLRNAQPPRGSSPATC
jgi:hypothetical protein